MPCSPRVVVQEPRTTNDARREALDAARTAVRGQLEACAALASTRWWQQSDRESTLLEAISACKEAMVAVEKIQQLQ